MSSRLIRVSTTRARVIREMSAVEKAKDPGEKTPLDDIPLFENEEKKVDLYKRIETLQVTLTEAEVRQQRQQILLEPPLLLIV